MNKKDIIIVTTNYLINDDIWAGVLDNILGSSIHKEIYDNIKRYNFGRFTFTQNITFLSQELNLDVKYLLNILNLYCSSTLNSYSISNELEQKIANKHHCSKIILYDDLPYGYLNYDDCSKYTRISMNDYEFRHPIITSRAISIMILVNNLIEDDPECDITIYDNNSDTIKALECINDSKINIVK